MRHEHGYDGLTHSELMNRVKRGWKGVETPCGSGSTMEASRLVRSHLARIAQNYQIRTVSDAGAGDLHWIRFVDWQVEYRGFDLYPRASMVQEFDITSDILPESDLILCRHVLNHLSIRQCEDALERFRESGSTYLLMTMNPRQLDYWQQFNLERPEPIEAFDDTGRWWLELSRLS